MLVLYLDNDISIAIALPSTSPNSELLAAALRYRIPSTSQHPFFNEPLQTQRTQRKSDTFGQLRYRTPPNSPNSELLAAALRYRTPSTSQKAIIHLY